MDTEEKAVVCNGPYSTGGGAGSYQICLIGLQNERAVMYICIAAVLITYLIYR